MSPSAAGSTRHVGAELQRERALLLAGGGRDHAARAERVAELDRERADAAGGAVHDDALALGHAPGGAVEVPGGRPLDDHRERRAVVEAVRDREDVLPRRGRVLGVAAGPDERDDALAGVLAHAGHLAARDERQRGLLHVGVRARVGVGEVEPGAGDPDQHLAPAGSGVGSSASLSTSGPPNSVIWIARMRRG